MVNNNNGYSSNNYCSISIYFRSRIYKAPRINDLYAWIIIYRSAGYTLLYDEHVRVDSFYREATVRYKSLVNIFGTLFLLFPFILVTFLMSFPYVKRSWKILEGSPETSGLNATYLFKTVLIIFPFLLFLQAIVIFTNSIKNLRNEK